MADLTKEMRDLAPHSPVANKVLNQAADELERLTAERDALREDAGRYRWLRNEAQSSDWEYIGHQTAINSDREIDAAIAARKATP